MRLYRLKLAYDWEMEAFKLQGGEENAKKRAKVEEFFLAHMKATAPEKYHERLTPNYPVSKSFIKRIVPRNVVSNSEFGTMNSSDASGSYSTRTTFKRYMLQTLN